MITFHNPHHAQHQGQFEMFRGQLVPCFEVPARVDDVLAELQRRKLGEVHTPPRFDGPRPPVPINCETPPPKSWMRTLTSWLPVPEAPTMPMLPRRR